MKIKTKREIEIPDGFTCEFRGRKCTALEKVVKDGQTQNHAFCCNFNSCVFWRDGVGWVKSRECVDATLDYLNRGDPK